MVTIDPGRACESPPGSWSSTMPSSSGSVTSCEDRARTEAGVLDDRARVRGRLADHVGDGGQLGAGRDRDLRRSSPRRRQLARAGALRGDEARRRGVAGRLGGLHLEPGRLELGDCARLALVEHVGHLDLSAGPARPAPRPRCPRPPAPRPSGSGRRRCPRDAARRRSTRRGLRPTSLRASTASSYVSPTRRGTSTCLGPVRDGDRDRAAAGDLRALPRALLDDDVQLDPPCSAARSTSASRPALLDALDRQLPLDSLDERHADGRALLELVLNLVVGPPAGERGGGDQQRDEEPRHPAPALARRLVVRARGRVGGRPPRRRGGGGGRHHAGRALGEELGRLARRPRRRAGEQRRRRRRRGAARSAVRPRRARGPR